ARLSHPNIVAALDAEQAVNLHFLVMEVPRRRQSRSEGCRERAAADRTQSQFMGSGSASFSKPLRDRRALPHCNQSAATPKPVSKNYSALSFYNSLADSRPRTWKEVPCRNRIRANVATVWPQAIIPTRLSIVG